MAVINGYTNRMKQDTYLVVGFFFLIAFLIRGSFRLVGLTLFLGQGLPTLSENLSNLT